MSQNNSTSETSSSAELVQSPKITLQGKITQTAVKDAAQAYSACKGLEAANRDRDKNDSIIDAKYNGEAPYSAQKLRNAKQSWRYNVSTGALSSIIDRKSPELVDAVVKSRILTSASLDPKLHPDANRKSIFLQRRWTRLVKEWEEWRDWLSDTAQETCAYGRGLAAWTDLLDWRPECFPHGSYYLPDGSRMVANLVQAVALKRPLLIHEAIDKVTKAEVSETAGWNVENLVKAINEASPEKLGFNTGDRGRQQEDAMREWSTSMSYTMGAKVIEMWDYFATEPGSTVTQVTMERSTGNELFIFPSRFSQMSDCIALFTMQQGNRKFYGSKGIGRNCLNLTNAIEQQRNLFLDAIKMSTIKAFKVDPKAFSKMNNLQFTIASPFAFLAVEGEEMQTSFEVDPALYNAADNKLTGLAELMAGAILPGQIGMDNKSDKTATEATIDAQNQAQLKVGTIERWLYQVFKALSTMQRRSCDPRTNDPEAKKFQEDCFAEQITPEELKYWAEQPCLSTIDDIQMMQMSEVEYVQARYSQSPYINQKALQKAALQRSISPELMDVVWMEDEVDQTIKAEAIRQQRLESSAMFNAEVVPVSPRDNHQVHLETIGEDFQKLAQVIEQSPTEQLINAAQLGYDHGMEHVAMWKQSGAAPEVTAQAEQMLAQVKEGIAQAKPAFQQATQAGMLPPAGAAQ